MFYPGDPIDERKRELIRKLMSGRNAQGSRTGRSPGFAGFARGMGFGGIGGLAPHIAARGGFQNDAFTGIPQRVVEGPSFHFGGDNPPFPVGPIQGFPNTPQMPVQPPALINSTPDLFQRVSQYGKFKAF